ncbi:MAG: Fe-S cluster assembly sulfur transfer protein SufU [Candidatus Berkiella sp.]
MNELLSLYQEVILDHSRHPRHFGELASATHQATGVNPLCGDEMTIFVKLADQTIQNIQFTGSGCAIMMASASLLTEQLTGKTLLQAQDCFAAFLHLVETGDDTQAPLLLGKLKIFSSVHHFPIRVKCATLPWHALKEALCQNGLILPP